MATIEEYAAGLRELADFVDAHPDLFKKAAWCGETFNLFAYTPEEMAEMTRMLGSAQKNVTTGWFSMTRMFGPHKVEVNIARDSFCEKKQTGTRIITKPDPEACQDIPMIEVEEPVYEWVCPESVLDHPALEAEQAVASGDANTPWKDEA